MSFPETARQVLNLPISKGYEDILTYIVESNVSYDQLCLEFSKSPDKLARLESLIETFNQYISTLEQDITSNGVTS